MLTMLQAAMDIPFANEFSTLLPMSLAILMYLVYTPAARSLAPRRKPIRCGYNQPTVFVECAEVVQSATVDPSPANILWLHGWRQTHACMKPLAELFSHNTNNYFVDLPGFGCSSEPRTLWNSEDYANAIWQALEPILKETDGPTVVVGHSYGGRVALQLARQYPDRFSHIVLLAASGLPIKRKISRRMKQKTLFVMAKTARLLEKICRIHLRDRFGRRFRSADYQAAEGIMKSIFLKGLKENLAEVAKGIQQPTLIIYGAKDTDALPAIGQRYADLIHRSQYIELPQFDHHTILYAGRYQLQHLITQFLKNTPSSSTCRC
jgi:pimeloyl-ACP methyl ester carboxylesterase